MICAAAAFTAFADAAQCCTHIGFGSGGAGKHFAAIAGNHGCIDMEIRTVDCQSRYALLCNANACLTGPTKTLLFLGQHVAAPYFFLVSLIVIFSSA